MKKKVHLGLEKLKAGPCSFKDASDEDLIQEMMSRKGAKTFVVKYTQPMEKDKLAAGALEAHIELAGTAQPDLADGKGTSDSVSKDKKPKLAQAETSEDDDDSSDE